MKSKINITVKMVPHPTPQRLVDLWAQLVLKEVQDREREEQSS